LASNRDGSNWPRAGTLFLDEICDTPPSMQAKLLRVLQDKKFERIGGSQTLAADVRIICATNKNIKDEVNAGREKTLEELEKERILAVLARNRWNQSKAAEVLVIHRNTLREKIKKFNLKLPLESK
jgi:transcriptional regulator with GAF, ATPase, and Fis domain